MNPVYKFVVAYRMLLHAESNIVSHIMEEGMTAKDLIGAHNVIEDAKREVVQEYMKFTAEQSEP